MEHFRMLVGGRDVDALSGATFETENPYTGEPWAVVPDGGPADVDAAVGAARAALEGEWGALTGFQRAVLLHRLADPGGVVNVVTGLSRETGAALAGHPGIDKVAFTGSTATGRAVARAAADNLTKVTLELGGKSPQVVFGDADLKAAANGVVAGVFAATGQTCMAGSRLIVHTSVHDELVSLVASRAARIRLGDPNDAATEMGPVANRPQHEKVLGHLSTARAKGRPWRTAGRPRTGCSCSRPC